MIEKAETNEIKSIVRTLKRLHEESEFRNVRLDEHVLEAFLKQIIISPASICLIEKSGEDIVAVFVGYVNRFFFSEERGAWDVVFYVVPERRRSVMAARLFKAATDWARSHNVKKILFGVSTGISLENAKKFFEDSGMRTTGHNFSMDA